MALPTIQASPWPKMKCPRCGETMTFEGDGRYVCPHGCGEFLQSDDGAPNADDKLTGRERRQLQAHESKLWPELVANTNGRMRQAMMAVATLPLGTADVTGPCRGHGGKGGSKSSGGKSPARQKYEAWKRKMGPGRSIRSIRIGR